MSWERLREKLVQYRPEARGITRVDPSERHDLRTLGYGQIFMLWFSINLAANNITLGMLGPSIFNLAFTEASLCAVFGMLVGCLPVAVIATFGPRSGLRTLVFSRYVMGWWPSKLIVILNIIVLLGYALIDSVIAGQMLSAISGNTLSVVLGIIIVALLTWLVTTFGYQMFHHFERYAWIPQLAAFSVLAGVAGPRFDMTSYSDEAASSTVGSRLSFFSLCLAAAVTYSGTAADYFVYYPEKTPPWRIFFSTILGLSLSFTFAFLLGIGLASGANHSGSWASALEISQGSLIVEGFQPLGSFGKFCALVMALGLTSNMMPPTYSSGLDFQMLGSLASKVPRVIWNTFGVLIYTICALAGKSNLAAIFVNFLALMGYWICIWFAIVLEEFFIFQRLSSADWTLWNQREKLPEGKAAFAAFIIGWTGAILSMAQVWFTGPIAKLVGDTGADMGNYVAFAFAAVSFPPLRFLELRNSGR